MKILFISEIYVYRQRLKNKIKLNGPFLWTGITCLQVLRHYWDVDYFHRYLSQMPKTLSHSSYILRNVQE